MPEIERFDDVIAAVTKLNEHFIALVKLHRTAMHGFYQTKGGGWAATDENRKKNIEISQEYKQYLENLKEDVAGVIHLFRVRWSNKSPNTIRWLAQKSEGWYRRVYYSAEGILKALGEAIANINRALEIYHEGKYWTTQPEHLLPNLEEVIKALTPPKDRDLAKLRAEFDDLRVELVELPGKIERFIHWKSFAENIVAIAQSVEKEFVPRLRKWSRAGKDLMLETHVPKLSTSRLGSMTIEDIGKLSEESQNEVNVMLSSLSSVIERLGIILKYAEDDEKGLKALEKAIKDAEERLKIHRKSIEDIEKLYEERHLGASKATTDGLKMVEVSLGHELHYHKIIEKLAREIVLRIERQVAALSSLREHIEKKSIKDIQSVLSRYLLLASPSRPMARRWKRVSFIDLVRLLAEMIKKDEEAMGKEHEQLKKLEEIGLPIAA